MDVASFCGGVVLGAAFLLVALLLVSLGISAGRQG